MGVQLGSKASLKRLGRVSVLGCERDRGKDVGEAFARPQCFVNVVFCCWSFLVAIAFLVGADRALSAV